MANIKIAVINHCSLPEVEDELHKVVYALQTQVNRDFAPAWGIEADLRILPKGKKPRRGEWWLVILDNSDQAGAVGYHDVTPEGLPLCKVYAKTDAHYGHPWSMTASHELLEMLCDPNINLTVFDSNEHGFKLYSYEICDPCQGLSYAYKIDGVQVSNFVFPAWFESFRKKGTRFDFMQKISKPFQLLKGGYIGLYDSHSGHGWTQQTAEAINIRARPPVGSRRERRGIPMSQRIVSSLRKEK